LRGNGEKEIIDLVTVFRTPHYLTHLKQNYFAFLCKAPIWVSVNCGGKSGHG
jgi:hypothetical protein